MSQFDVVKGKSTFMGACRNEEREFVLRHILTGEFFEYILHSFQAILDSNEHRVLVIISRKGYCLFKAFEPLLHNRSIPQKIIVSDKAIGSAIHKLKEAYQPGFGWLIIDDTILYGRTSSYIIDELIKNGIHETDIKFFALSGLSDLKKCSRDDQDIPHFTEENNQYFFQYSNDGKRGSVRVEGKINFRDEPTVRAHSALFLRAIHATLTPYDANVPSFELQEASAKPFLDHFEKLQTSCSRSKLSNSRKKIILDCLKNTTDIIAEDEYCFFNHTTKDMSELGVVSFCLAKHLENDISLFIRFYVSDLMQTVRVIPYAIFPGITNVNEVYDTLKELCFKDVLHLHDKEFDAKTKYRILRYVITAVLGVQFLNSACVKILHVPNGDQETVDEQEVFPVEQYVIESLLNGSVADMWAEGLSTLPFMAVQVSDSHIEENECQNKTAFLDGAMQKSVPQREVLESYFQKIGEFDKTVASKRTPGRGNDGEDQGELLEALVRRFESLKVEKKLGRRFRAKERLAFLADIIFISDDGKTSLYVYSNEEFVGLFIKNGEQCGQYLAYEVEGLSLILTRVYNQLGKKQWKEQRADILDDIKAKLKLDPLTAMNTKQLRQSRIITAFKEVEDPRIYNLYLAYDIGASIFSDNFKVLSTWYEEKYTQI